jgi:hypothetical protein
MAFMGQSLSGAEMMWNEVWEGAGQEMSTSQVQMCRQAAGLLVKMGNQGHFEAAGG